MPSRLQFAAAPIAAFTLAFSFAGCGPSGPELTDVAGRVTLDGKPVANANLTFVPKLENGSPSYGVTDADGRYTLRFTFQKDGAMPGTHDVMIETQQYSAAEKEEMRQAGREVPEAVSLPRKYAKPGELTAEVEQGSNEIDFDLKSE